MTSICMAACEPQNRDLSSEGSVPTPGDPALDHSAGFKSPCFMAGCSVFQGMMIWALDDPANPSVDLRRGRATSLPCEHARLFDFAAVGAVWPFR